MGDKKYFHELTKAEYDALIGSGMTWGGLMEQYDQPPWCRYPDALEGQLGCYKLLLGKVHDRADCVHCELASGVPQEPPGEVGP